jgi:hypothetical protein
MTEEKEIAFHFDITNLTHDDIKEKLKFYGVTRDTVFEKGKPDYFVSRCCALHCEEIYAYRGMRNPGYCEKHRRYGGVPQGVPYGQSKL